MGTFFLSDNDFRSTNRHSMNFSRLKQTNMGRLDRTLRISIGSCLAYAAFVAPWWINIPSINLAMGLFGLMNIVSASTGVCPGYILARVSTLSETSQPQAAPPRLRNSSTDGMAVALRNKLMLCIVLPGVLGVGIFGVILHHYAGELVLNELTANGRAVALLASRLTTENAAHSQYAKDVDDTNPSTQADGVAGILFHDRSGQLLPHIGQKLPEGAFKVSDLLHLVTDGLSEHQPHNLGRWQTPTSDLLWVIQQLPEKGVWVTAIVDTDNYNSTLTMLLGPRVFALILIMMWVTLWGAIYNVRKYTQRIALDAREQRLRSLHDPLTGLFNRMGLDEMLQQGPPAPISQDSCSAFVVINLTGFRAINDSFGHELADQLLCQVADRIRSGVSSECTVIRMDGDTFGIFCTGLRKLDHAQVALERLHEAVDSSYSVGDMTLTLASRSGIAFAPQDTGVCKDMVRFADLALSRAKRTRVKTCRYDATKDTRNVRKLTLMSALRQAIDNDELEIHYQPKTSLADGTLSGVEALARWTHPSFGAVSPEEFVSLAEQGGLIDSLTRWVLLTVERQSSDWCSRGLRIPIAVNLSPLNLLDPTLFGLVERLVTRGSLGHGLLELELTENAVMEDADLALDRLCALRKLGVTLAIDDFGSGQSSFAYLQRFPISNLKIDKQFVMPLAGSADDSDVLLLRSMIDLGHNMGFVVTAEGIEDEGTLRRLQTLGCNYAQGYHIARPMTASAFDDWMVANGNTWTKAA